MIIILWSSCYGYQILQGTIMQLSSFEIDTDGYRVALFTCAIVMAATLKY